MPDIKLNHENPVEQIYCDECYESYILKLSDGKTDISVGLITVLECLYLVEKEGGVPPISYEWWNQLKIRYCLDFTKE